MESPNYKPSEAQISRSAINRLRIAMRHLFIRGSYKPLGVSGEAMISALRELQPEIYGSINDSEKMELEGLLYIFQRLPRGIEESRYVNLIGREGYENSKFKAIVPSKRRRNCYRVDKEQMFIEMTRGRSDIYDILTHLTFLYIEAEKIKNNALDAKGRINRSWSMLKKYIDSREQEEPMTPEVGFTYLSTLLGRTYEHTKEAYYKFEKASGVNDLFSIVYHMGRLSLEEYLDENDRMITFSSSLRQNLGYHIYGEKWAFKIKKLLHDHKLLNKELHVISANLHSVMNMLYAKNALQHMRKSSDEEIATHLSNNPKDQDIVLQYALDNGMYEVHDESGTNISVQIFDLSQIEIDRWVEDDESNSDKVIIVMDYAFGEQAYETMDELLKPHENSKKIFLNFKSVNIMGKAGILMGGKGDIMIPDAHVFEGTADNYPFDNALSIDDFEGHGLLVYEGTMITVLGTSLQNKNILRYFLKSSWGAVGLEMEGAHYQKAIQAASKIRKNISPEIVVRYAYYASDNPLESGATLASGSLGAEGVKPTYLITSKILEGILKQ